MGHKPTGPESIRPETLCPERREARRSRGIDQPHPFPPPAQAPLDEHLRIRPCRLESPLPV